VASHVVAWLLTQFFRHDLKGNSGHSLLPLMCGCAALLTKIHDGSVFLLRDNTYCLPAIMRVSTNTVIRSQTRRDVDVVDEHQTWTLSVLDAEDAVSISMNTSPSDNRASLGENGGWAAGPCPKDVAHLNRPRL
jgi:hypothetical protein